ncbi:ABC transporter ATP-binding protein [Dermabacter vaginalis]|uniref:ABC transporter ATP-binding protein n=1 Tax=Dermabacter vaginalis TaxID=1630135 RepID=A0ABX6A5H3_9MICO|nr:ABC transporter ATP-binding protein [Dermabacter vaginalis]MCG7442726.1 ABC transporter ATP-binding protein [Dermabacter vaginalis]MCT2150788.1 ABC transporter ATP-binding protein [Dermabacter vaginalis]QEU11859.1 ABC transporter ATP-binding protein [Dermabacter vaginalis]
MGKNTTTVKGSPKAAPASALEIANLRKQFGDVTACENVSLTANFGEITALLGPNGAGKSTTIACATGLLNPDGGEVRLLGSNPRTHDAETRARVGVMLQDGGLTSGATAKHLLEYASCLYSHPRNWRVLSSELGIDAFASTLVRRLSGGQRQRLSLALALLGEPDVLFLDEPTAGMDAAVKRRTRELIRAEAERGAAVILTSHALDDIASLADRIIVIAGGVVRADGTLADVESTLGNGTALALDVSATAPAQENLTGFERAVREAATAHGVSLTVNRGPASLEDILVTLSTHSTKEQK